MENALESLSQTLFDALAVILIVLPAGILVILIAITAGIINRRKNKFYDRLAKNHNLIHRKDRQIDLMKGFRSRLFKYERTIKTSGVLEGKHQGRTFFIFTKTFYVGFSSKVFTVGCSEFGTTEFPHILLKSKKIPLYQGSETSDRKISIEKEYLKDFDLYCPEKCEIESLQIFTEHVLGSIQAISEQFSIEFGGNRMYIYINKDIQNAKNEKDIGKMIEIVKEIISKTDGLLLRLKDDFEALDAYFKDR